jgi:fermentation-respiration switch protein FrsA (DUF1100 family)
MSTRKPSRRILAWAIILLIAAYGGIVAWFSAHESDLLYFPEKVYEKTPDESGMVYGKVQISSTDIVRLVAWLIPSADTSTLWLLYLHGNAGNIGKHGYVEHYAGLHKLGLNILAVDYRGYGESSGTPAEQGLYDDARAGYDYLRSSQHVPGERIVVYGYSLGSAVAVDLASRVPVAGLIVEGSFTSLPDVGQYHYPFLPVRLIAKDRFASDEKIGAVSEHKLFIHAIDDQTVPIRYGRELFELALQPKIFLEVKGGHENAHEVDADLFYGGVRLFLVQIAAHGASSGSMTSLN